MGLKTKIAKFYSRVIKDHHQEVRITGIEDIAKTSVSYEQRIQNENQTFDLKPRDAETGNEVAVNNHFVIEYLVLERKLSAYQGRDLWKYVEHFVNNRKFTKILSIGSGPCAVEMEIAQNFTADYHMDCLDLNENLINFATAKAKHKKFNLNPMIADVNEIAFEEEYDLIMAVASLHHFITLENIFQKINRALKPDGEFVTYEPICRSGMFLYRRQRWLLAVLFMLLPAKYRVNHQDYPGEKRVDRLFNEFDRSGWTFECVRSGDIAPILKKKLKVKHWGRGMTFLRRVSDSIYGQNYRWEDKKDRRVAKILCWVDRFVRFFHLVPVEGLFFIGKKR